MNRMRIALAPGLFMLAASLFAGVAGAHAPSPVVIEIVGPDGRAFREFPMDSRDGALRSYLQAEKGARYEVRVRNTTGERVGLVVAVDGRNIINGKRSELARSEPMYVLDAWGTQSYSGWRASLQAVNEFYFTDWKESYAEAFGDRSARGVISVAVFREVPREAPPRIDQPYSREPDSERQSGRAGNADSAAGAPPVAEAGRGAAKSESARRRDESAGTGYGDRRIDHAVRVEFAAQSDPDRRHFIKYEWRETLCRKQIMACGEQNRFWDESMLGFAPPPPRR
jgi:hypothetical protein